MRKILTIVCILAVLTSFASCGENQEDNSSIATEVNTETKTTEAETESITEKIIEEETTVSEEVTETKSEPTTETVTEPEPTVIYEESGLKVFYKGLTSDDLLGYTYINLYIENDCGQDVTVQCNDFYINDFVTDFTFSCDIADGKKANDKISIWKSDLDANNLTIDNIEKIEFSFHVINEESWDTIFDSPAITINTLQNNAETEITTSEIISEFETTAEQPVEEPILDAKVITATDIMHYFIDNNAPAIGEYIERTESDDKLLGRPEQYISKVSFRITTVELNEEDPYDASIEVFNNADDALKRYSEASSLMEQYPMFKEYLCLKNNVLLRMKFDVLPSDEQVYEQLLDTYMAD